MSKTLYVRIPGNSTSENIEYLQYNGYGNILHIFGSDMYQCTRNADLIPISLADVEFVDEETAAVIIKESSLKHARHVQIRAALTTLREWYEIIYPNKDFDLETVTNFYDYLTEKIKLGPYMMSANIRNSSDLQQGLLSVSEMVRTN